MNPQNPPDHVRFIVSWVGALALCAMGVGGTLLYKGFQGGELLIGAAITAIGGLLGTIQPPRRNQTPAVNDPDTVQTVTTETKVP